MTLLSHHTVLDHGEVSLLARMADDAKVYGAARVSGGAGVDASSKGEKQDRGLIRYLMEHHHGTPFEHAVFQWYVKAPIFVVREWQRHRIASYNEQSGRYSKFEPEFYQPNHIRIPDPDNKQGSRAVDPGDDTLWSNEMFAELLGASQTAFEIYERLLARNVSREMARFVLPLNLYTRFWFTINARSLMNFLALRNHEAAQWEIRAYAIALEEDFAEAMPWTWEAFVDNGRVAP